MEVAGDPDPNMDSPTDLPHWVILTLHVRSVLHAQLFSARSVLLRHFDCGRPDHRTSFHLSIDYFVLGGAGGTARAYVLNWAPGSPAGIDIWAATLEL